MNPILAETHANLESPTRQHAGVRWSLIHEASLEYAPATDEGSKQRLSTGSSWLRLRRPRYAEVIPDGTIVIVDSDHNRVLASTLDGALIWELSHVPDSPLPRLCQPRWAELVYRYEVVICDNFNHRILHIKGSQVAKTCVADE